MMITCCPEDGSNIKCTDGATFSFISEKSEESVQEFGE